ncbi:MAG: lysoplasmalogenase [Clostridia bacterium]|nr:lysoplasmalogenase [Clostridia bacterium]
MDKNAVVTILYVYIIGIGSVLLVRLILLSASVISALVYIFGSNPRKRTERKALASLFFVLYGLAAVAGQMTLNGRPSAFSVLVLSGLALGAVGDVLLEVSRGRRGLFVAGGASFAAGHLLYIAAFALVCPGHALYAVAAAVPAAVLITVTLCAVFGIGGQKRAAVAVYACVLSFMASYAVICAFVSRDTRFLRIASGAVLFLASDILLAINIFSKNKKKAVGTVCLLCYYAGQLLIASGLYQWSPW